MKDKRSHITVFEHQSIKKNQVVNGVKIDETKIKSLQVFYGEKGVPYFSLIHNGIKFNEYVGAIQVGNLLIEVLPKADKKQQSEEKEEEEKKKWRDILIDMLRAVGSFDIKAPSYSNLKIKTNSVLDLYFELFVKEVEYLQHNGLVKQYRKKEGNVTALKGRLQFARHLQYNLTHQERFFVRHTTYDVEHKLHYILFKTIRLIGQINTNANLHSRIGNLLLNFPEMPDLKINESTFDHIVFNRKTQSYKKAIELSRLILLQYHPDLSKGKNHVLALMFDMNKLWEEFVLVSLRRNKIPGSTVSSQVSKLFWKPNNGNRSSIRPDIIINRNKPNCVVLDTKWKNLNGYNPSPEDLRQMYVYHDFFDAKKVALVYPGSSDKVSFGTFSPSANYSAMDRECSVILLSVPDEQMNGKSVIKIWQDEIKRKIESWRNEGINISQTQC